MTRRVGFVLLFGMVASLVGVVCFAIGGRLGFTHGYLLAGQTSDILAANRSGPAISLVSSRRSMLQPSTT